MYYIWYIFYLLSSFYMECVHFHHPQSLAITIQPAVWLTLPITLISLPCCLHAPNHIETKVRLRLSIRTSIKSLQLAAHCQTNEKDSEERERKHQHVWVLNEYECVLRETKERVLSEGDNRPHCRAFWLRAADTLHQQVKTRSLMLGYHLGSPVKWTRWKTSAG